MPLRTTTELLETARRRCMLPDGEPFSDAEILAFADDEIAGPLSTLMIELCEETFAAVHDQTLVPDAVAYRFPADAATTLRDILRVDSSGHEHDLFQVDKSRLRTANTDDGPPVGFILDGHRVRMWPTPKTTGETLRIKYRHLPRLLTTSGTTLDGSFNAGEGFDVGLTAAVAAWTASTANYNVLADHGAHNLYWRFTGQYDSGVPDINASAEIYPETGVYNANLGFDEIYRDYGGSDPRFEPRAGDIIALDGYTHVPQVHNEGWDLLCSMTARAMVEAHTQRDAHDSLHRRIAREEKRYRNYLAKRVDGEADTHYPDSSLSRWM